jgi:hypothetical protein
MSDKRQVQHGEDVVFVGRVIGTGLVSGSGALGGSGELRSN